MKRIHLSCFVSMILGVFIGLFANVVFFYLYSEKNEWSCFGLPLLSYGKDFSFYADTDNEAEFLLFHKSHPLFSMLSDKSGIVEYMFCIPLYDFPIASVNYDKKMEKVISSSFFSPTTGICYSYFDEDGDGFIDILHLRTQDMWQEFKFINNGAEIKVEKTAEKRY